MAELTTQELFDPEALLALSRRRTEAGVLSIYVAADLGADPGLAAAAIDLKNRLAELDRNIAADGPRERLMALRDAQERLAPEIERLTNPREHGRGRALFAPLDADAEPIRFAGQMPLPTRVVLDDGPFIHPLLELLDEGQPAGVLLASQDEVRILEWRLAELAPLEQLEPEVVEAPHERAGPVGSSPSPQAQSPRQEQHDQRARDRTRRFLDRAHDAARRHAADRGWTRILVSAGDRLTEPLAAGLGTPQHVEVIRDTRVLTGLDPADLAATITERLHAQHDEYEARLVQRAREATLAAGPAALGLSDVVGALNEGRVAHLIYDPEVRYTGTVDADGRLHAGRERPAGGDVAAEPRLTERLVEQALATGARVTPVEGAAAGALAKASGVAALLRW